MNAWGKCLLVLSIAVFLYLAWYVYQYSWAAVLPDVIPSGIKDQRIDAKVGVSSAIQETVGLLTTLLLAVTAFFAFSIGDKLDEWRDKMAVAIVFCAVYSWPLTIGILSAYEIYRAIALQLDGGYLFLQPLSNLLARQTECLILCLAVSVVAFGWRCATRP
jgi:hypothetical protein